MAQRVHAKVGRLRGVLARSVAYVSSFAVAVGPTLPAYADVIASGATATVVTPDTAGSVFDVTTTTVSGAGIAYNAFSKFNVVKDTTVNLYQPTGAKALVNVVQNTNGDKSVINGTLNTLVGVPGSATGGSNVFIVDPNGFVVGASGVINANRLTMSTATQAFGQALLDEAASGASSYAERLFAGDEDLSAASIETYGVINASRLDLRAGARMLLGGQINVVDTAPDAAGVVSVVNTEAIEQASGVSTKGGVLRFTSGSGGTEISGNITARRNGAGGVVTGKSEGDITLKTDPLKGTGLINVTGAASADAAGSVLLFAEGSARMEAGFAINAQSVAGNGGFVFIEAKAEDSSFDPSGAVTLATPSIVAQGALLTYGRGANGYSWLSGETVEVTGTLQTQGGDLLITADEGVVMRANAAIDSRRAGGLDTAGNVVVSAPAIVMQNGSSIQATGTGATGGGLVALIARDVTDDPRWNINVENNKALIRLENASITAGAVVLNATAKTANILGADDAALEEQQLEDYEGQQASVEDQLIDFLGTVEDTVISVMEQGLQSLQAAIPVQVQVMAADARIVITDSDITAAGNWKGKALTVTSDFTGDTEARGIFAADGLLEGGLSLFGTTGPAFNVTLPTAFDPSQEAIFVHAHAQTDVAIAPKAYALGVGVSVTNTDARVQIRNSDLRSTGGTTGTARNIAVRSTASENLNVAIAPSKVAGISVGVIVAVHALRNQLVVDGGSITSAGKLDVAALSTRNHATSVVANAGKDGKGAVALNVEIGNALTEAALGGTIRTQGDLNLDAETLYFGKAHTTSSTLGLADPTKTAINKTAPVAALKGKVTEVTNSIKERLSGKKKEEEDPNEEKKPGFAFGLSFDLQIDRDDTYATLGGKWRDLANDRALVALGTTSVQTGALGAVNVTSGLRFASTAEGGTELTRAIDSSMGFLDRVAEAELARINAALTEAGQPTVTKEELVGQYGNAVFLNGSVMLMSGETVAEIGSNATITQATAVNVNAKTIYPEFDRFTDVRDAFVDFATAVSEFSLLDSGPDEDAVPAPAPALPDVVALADLGNYLTTYTGAYAEQNQIDDASEGSETKSQNLAVAVSVNVFNTSNTTRAAIREGAKIDLSAEGPEGEPTLAGAVAVNAVQRGLYTHMQNFPTDLRTVTNPLGSNDNVANTVGGAATVARTASRVEALVEGNAEVTAETLDIDAHNRAIVFNLVYAGGSAANVAINAAIAAQAVENVTVARLSDQAIVKTGDLTIGARDDSVIIGLAGAFAGSDGAVSVGASGVVNFAKRQLYAGIGPAERGAALAGTAGETRITADTLTITADNKAITVATSVAGSRVSGKPVDDSPTPPADESNDEDMIIPSWLFAEDETEALSAQNDVTPPSESGTQTKTGWAVAGAATINLMLQNETVAEIASNARIELTGALDMAARNTSYGITGAGAVSAGLGTTQKNNALAGAFAVTVDERDVKALVRGATISADSIEVRADDNSVVVGVAVGGAGSSNGQVTVAGSVAVNVLTGETRTEVTDASLTSVGDIGLEAEDRSLTVGVGGAVSINLSTSEGAGVGVGIAVNVVDRGASTRVSGATLMDGDALRIAALSRAQVFGFGVSVGAGKTGVAGSIAVNTITGGAQTLVGNDSGARVGIKAGSLSITAEENNQIWSLAGALTIGQKTAVGGALTANVIVISSGAELVNTDVAARDLAADAPEGTEAPVLGAVSVSADSSSLIGTLAVAGAASAEGAAVGVGLSGNNITAGLTTSVAGSTIAQAESVQALADNTRIIRSLGGGVAGSGAGAGGFASTLNLLIANDTIVTLDGSEITSRGDILAAAKASGTIQTAAVAVSASGANSIGGAATVNVSTGQIRTSANGAVLEADGALTLKATDAQTIQSLAGGVALSSGGGGVGAALAANVIVHDTVVEANGAALTARGGDLSLLSSNAALIESLSVGLAVAGGSAAVAGSISVGYIGNKTRVTADGTSFVAGTEAVAETPESPAVAADPRAITLAADKTSTIRILSGSAAGGSSAAVGAAVTVAVIQDTVTTDLVANARIFGGALNVSASNKASIDAIAIAGAVSSSTAVAGSFVYTQIGKPPSDAASVPVASTPAAGAPAEGETTDPAADGTAEAEGQRDDALAAIRDRGGYQGSIDLNAANDVTRARLALSAPDIEVAGIDINATELSKTQSFAGTLAASSNVGVGVGIGVNLLFGRTEAELVIPEGATARTNGVDVRVAASQTGTIDTLGVALGGAGTVGGAGSILVNVFDRAVLSRVIGADTDGDGQVDDAILLTEGGDVTVSANQSGTINALAGVVAVGGVAGVGGAFGVSVLADRNEAAIEAVRVNTALVEPAIPARPLWDAGRVDVLASNEVELLSIVAAAAGGGKGAFGGSVAVNVAQGSVTAALRRATVQASAVQVAADVKNTLGANAGALSVGGFFAGGMGVTTNVSRMNVLADIDASTLRADGDLRLTANANTAMSGIAVGGAATIGVAVVGTGVGNSAKNTVSALIRNTGAATDFGGSDIVTRGSALVRATGTNTITLAATEDELEQGESNGAGVNLNFSVGAAGIGVAVSVNETANAITAGIADGSRLIALGETAISDGRLGTFRGAGFDALANTTIDVVTVNAAGGALAAVSGLLTFNVVSDVARVQIGGGTGARAAIVNGLLAGETDPANDPAREVGAFFDAAGEPLANLAQDTILRADVINDIEAYTLGVAVGAGYSVGAASGNNLIASTAEIELNFGNVGAARNVTANAKVDTALDAWVLGVGGGFVGTAGSVDVNVVTSKARIAVLGSQVDAGLRNSAGALRFGTLAKTDLFTVAGGAAGGAGAVAGGFTINLLDTTSEIVVQDRSDTTDGETLTARSMLSAAQDLMLDARTENATEGYAASAAGGAIGVALAANVNLVQSDTRVDIGAGTTLRADRNLGLRATEISRIAGQSGSLGVGAVGAGASLDYVNFAANTAVRIGAGAQVRAEGSLTATALAQRDVASTVGVGGIGLGGLSAAISVIELGGLGQDGKSDRDAALADIQRSLNEDQDTGSAGDKGRASDLAAYAGGADTRARMVAARQAVNVTSAPAVDGIGVSLGEAAVLEAAGPVTLTSLGELKVVQRVGSLSGGAVGISAAVGVVTVKTDSNVQIGRNAQIRSDGAITLASRIVGLNGGLAVDSRVASVAASGTAGAAAGISAVSASADARIVGASGAVLGGLNAQRAGSLTITAERTDSVRAEVYNLSVSGVGGVGAAVATARNQGQTVISLGAADGAASRIEATTVSLRARDASVVRATAEGATGGVFLAGNGAAATAESQGEQRVALTNTTVRAQNLTLSNRSQARAEAEAKGMSVAGGLAIGASFARAQMASSVATTLAGGSISATTVNLSTGIDALNGTNSWARSSSSSGGILSGNGADARAWLDYDVATTISGVINAAGTVTVLSDAAAARSRAIANGKSFGVAAIGLVLAQTGQSAGRTASVVTTLEQGEIAARGAVSITSSNAPDMAVDLTSGSGGVLQGSGAEALVNARTRTRTDIGTTGVATVASDTASVVIAAGHAARVDSVLDNRAGALMGASGAKTRTEIASQVGTTIGGQARIFARDLDISAANAVTRPYRDYNIKSASGGAIDVPAMISRVTVDATTDLDVNSGAQIVQTGDAFNPGTFNLGITTNMALSDRLFLDAGGAVAVPVGDSNVQVRTNNATVTIGAATLLGLGEMSIYNGGNADLRAEVDTKSYGVAGAATSITRATYNAANTIRLTNGADLESLGDVRLMAGHVKNAVQTVKLRAEARAFNKTAFPINIDPVADAIANTTSLIDIGEGARVTSVRDVYLLSEAGSRDVVGYGRGKDLYRQAFAAVGSFLSNLVGGGDVSLDIETGRSIDNNTDGIQVNGHVRAGSRNKQVLILGLDAAGNYTLLNDQTRQEGNPDAVYDNAWADDIGWTVTRNVAPAVDLQNRINEINGYLANPYLTSSAGDVRDGSGNLVSSTDPIRQAWIAELSTLRARQAGVAGLRVDWVELGPILAVEGNIIMRADYVQGTQTGELNAPGDALIKVWIESGAWLETDSMTIPTDAGGRITLNDVLVSNTDEVRVQSGYRPGPYAFNMISGEDDADPKIEVVTFTPDTGARGDGTIIVGGDLLNLRGEAFVNSNAGSVDIRADISARTIRVNANADVIVGYQPGVRNIGASPEGQYAEYFAARQDLRRFNPFYVMPVGSLGAPFTGRVDVPSGFVLLPTEGGLRAGRNVYITADVLNINGLIQAGTGTFDVTILAGIEAELNALRLENGRSGRVLIHDTAFPENERVAKSANITANTNVKVYYNYDTDQLELDDMYVRGGTVMITGNIISTGNGRIEALDGFGRVNINSAATTDLVVRRIDLGGEQDGTRGLAGLVRITDTSKTVAGGNFLITDFVRNGGALEVYNNAGPIGTVAYTNKVGENPDGTDITVTLYKPGDLVSRTTANGGRSASYDPTQNRDLIYVTAERTTREWDMKREELIVIGITGSKRKKVVNTRVKTIDETESLGSAPYIGASLVGYGDYPYAMRGNYYVESFTKSPEVKTHDSVRWWKLGSGWRHYEWTETLVTVQRYEHRLKADYPISIYFNGSDAAALNINTTGNVVFASAILNELGTTNVTSMQGSILSGSKDVILSTADTVLSAVNGSIRGVDGEFRLNQTATGTLSLVAGDLIDVREQRGNMNILRAETLRRPAGAATAQVGTVRLTAQGSIIQVGDQSVVKGSDIVLIAEDGGLGTSAAQPFRIDTDGGTLTARARNNLFVEELSGDLGLREVVSAAGDVTLIARDGSLLDRNNVETRDIRTLDELRTLWADELGLYGEAAIARRTADLIANIEDDRTQLYHDYWARRGAGTSAMFTLDQTLEAGLRRDVTLENGTVIPGWDDARINAYVAERQALFDGWNATETTYDPNRRITLAPADLDAVYTDTIAWSEQSLQRSLRAGLVRVRETGDTQIRVEDPNVRAAGNITLIARDSIGELLDPYVIARRSGALTDADLEVLFGAERQDIVIDEVTGEIRIRQNEDLNFAFDAVDGAGNAFGSLRVVAGTQEIFLSALTPATISRVESTGRVDLRIDGNMVDNADAGSQAVQGGVIILEAGNAGAIGVADNPLTVNVLDGGSLTARAGKGLYVHAPVSGMPLREIFSGGAVSLMAAGAITDLVGADVPRIISGGALLLDGASIGTGSALLGIRMDDTSAATATVITRVGDVHLKAYSDLPLERARIAGGGRIVLAPGSLMRLVSLDTVVFGADATLVLDLPEGIDTTASEGTDIAGGRLQVISNGTFGTATKPIVTDLVVLDYRAADLPGTVRDTSLWMRDLGTLRLETALMNANAGSITHVVAAQDLSVGLAQSVALTQLRAGRDLTEGRIIAERAELTAGRHMGGTSRLDLTVAEFQAETLQDGDATLLLRDRDVTIDFVTLNGTGALDLIVRNGATLLNAGTGITTQAGDLLMRTEDLTADADIRSALGNVDLGVDGTFLTTEDVSIRSTAGNVLLTASGQTRLGARNLIGSSDGTVDVSVGGDLLTGEDVAIRSERGTVGVSVDGSATIGDDNLIRTLNATDGALRMTVGGQLLVGAQSAPLIQANVDGALAVLRFGSVLNTGPTGLRVQVARIDSVVETGDSHLREEDAIIVEQVVANAGNVDLYTGGDTILRRAAAGGAGGGTVVIGSGGVLLGDTPDVTGSLIKLFAFGGRLGAETAGTAMRADTAPGAEVWLLARDTLDYAERAGDLRLAAGFSITGDATIRAKAGGITAGVLGAAGTLTLDAVGLLDVNLIGRSAIDIADEVGLRLVDDLPTRYGIYEVASPERLVLRARGAGSALRLGLGNVKGLAELYAGNLDANLYDVTPEDGLRLRLADGSTEGFALTDVHVIGDGARIELTDPFADVRPLLDGRFLAKLRPEDTRQSTAEGPLTIEFARIAEGQLTHAGPRILGQDIVINGDVWFRQRTFDLLATVAYRQLDVTADGQVLAWRFEPGTTRPVTGKIGFDLADEITLTTQHVFPLNRRLGGVSLNGGQGFVFGVGSETQIMVNPFLRNIGDPGVVTPLFSKEFGSGVPGGENPVLKFPLVLASL
ncbi:leukotoxin LktA family filamentous adhesin [Phaeovulum sp. NW3]|uniref:leukotoxin LktA family filamentous adhesin n=1 Tax=Phaeovulum sp. NW3 TaxID=2934933 RepID=UPI002021861A|nr:leukotoxin LktA family filamentous adhesin [Phaeovulum sp. NW3]MCL7465337.1 leukotoxin LktA family filamentous adhesin [Phaeovulum sp. NW3]